MALTNDLIKEFVEVTKDEVDIKTETTVYATVVEHDGTKYVKLDGSDLLTPAAFTTDVEPDERVTVLIKNHKAIVTGNISSPSARTDAVQKIGDEITEVEILIADKVSTKELDSVNGRIDNLQSDNILVKDTLVASNARIDELEANNVTINEKLTANEASITELETDKLSAKDADIKYATIIELDATNANIHNLEGDYASFKVTTTDKFTANEATIKDLQTNKLSATEAELKYANIDFSNIGEAAMEYFYANSGLIRDVVIGEGTITGNLVGVTIKGDLIEGGTVVADKLVIKGNDGLYYKLNTDGVTTEAEQTDYNSLNGSVITAKSITATKISVDDLVAFDATIGGFNITESSIYSGVKESVDNTTRGIYLDTDGQVAFGDSINFVKFHKVSEDNYRLDISAQSISLGTSNRDIEEAIDNSQTIANEAHSNSIENAARINDANIDIDSINSTISMLVTGQNGESLMTQTDTGWTFSLSSVLNALDSASSDISNLTEGLNSADNYIEALNQAVADLGEYTDYIKFGIDGGKPCIFLGETDSIFKVLITNTDIRFMEGSVTPASISNQALNIEKAVINGELRQGGFMWSTRSNGNYSLSWRGE